MDKKFMKRALELAKQGLCVSPNPMVGAVLTRNNHIISEGYHQCFGGNHAEINAFNNIPKNIPLDEVTLYVSLEPCSHHGKTPPCVDKIIELGIKKVIVACLDPNPLVAGNGIKKLKQNNIEVVVGICEEEAKQLNDVFFKYMTVKSPFIFVKCAMSLDGKTSTKYGESKWISSEESRQEVQQLRSKYTAIMVGVNTILKDNPRLTSRIKNGRDPIKIVVDTSLKTPLTSHVITSAKMTKTIIATCNLDESIHKKYIEKGVEILCCKQSKDYVNLQDLLTHLTNIDSILVEGGATLITSLLEENLIDKIRFYVAPKIFGGNSYSVIGGTGIDLLDTAYTLKRMSVRKNSEDIIIEGYLK